MLALIRSGRQADALRAYQSARAVLCRRTRLGAIGGVAGTGDRDPSTGRHGRAPCRSLWSHRDCERIFGFPSPRLIGRRHDLDALRPLLQAHRLVTLVGPGGVGKSRLAVEAAREWIGSGTTDIWLVELADVVDPDEVVPSIMAAIGLARTGSPSEDSRVLTEFLHRRPTLLLLDNCEHLIAAVARITQVLLESCETLRIWATSREGLAIPGEVLWPVPPLLLDDAVSLFVERGLAADPTSDLGDDSEHTHNAVASACVPDSTACHSPSSLRPRGCARCRSPSSPAGLEDRFRMLNRGARTALPRQQTLRAVVDWSYDLLFDDERRVFERLSVFGGTCTSVAARAVCADDVITGDDVVELVTRLADKSLVTVETDELDGYMRFRMLQTIVDYGRNCLESSGDAGACTRRSRVLLRRLLRAQPRGVGGHETTRLAPRRHLQLRQPPRRAGNRGARR